jgi:tetratricopeptide (TPR) repeat protein
MGKDKKHKNKKQSISLEDPNPSNPNPTPHVTFTYETQNITLSSEIKNKNLCLNMIVKNESNVIDRMLFSVAPYIDCYCICDTGSSDDTIYKIETFFKTYKTYIPGKIIKEPFRDFGYNRSFALKACNDFDVNYILLMDADMILQIDEKITQDILFNQLNKKEEDVFYIYQGSDSFFYKNVRIVKNHKDFCYWGVTHEYVKTPEGTKYGKFEKSEVFINDVGDGGCKSDKFARDIKLLEKGLETEPNNDRYTFYLANSYRDNGQLEKAIETYKKRIQIGGWFDEIWHSYYSVGKCYKQLNDMVNAVHWWMDAYNFFPNRIENLYEIIHHLRCNGKNNLAYGFYVMADNERTKHNHTDYLFLQKDVYDYKLDYELSIIGYYCNYMNYDLCKCSMKVLNCPFLEDNIAKNVFSNYKFYANPILLDLPSISLDPHHQDQIYKHNIDLLNLIAIEIPEIQQSSFFKSSTPSISITSNEELIVNLRFVDYTINSQGGYENRGVISTKNVIAIFDISNPKWVKINEFVLGYDKTIDNLYVGLEDIRLFSLSSKPHIYFNANRGLDYHNIQIEHGIIDIENKMVVSNLISSKNHPQNSVEKNWVLFENNENQMKVIYGWSPLVIGDIIENQFVKTNEINVPPFFGHLRGSTNGVKIKDEIWFICHSVSYEDRRYYYHILVVLDAINYKVKKYTPFFTFEKSKVEYTLGFVHLPGEDKLLIGYSIMDSQTKYSFIDKKTIENKMFFM